MNHFPALWIFARQSKFDEHENGSFVIIIFVAGSSALWENKLTCYMSIGSPCAAILKSNFSFESLWRNSTCLCKEYISDDASYSELKCSADIITQLTPPSWVLFLLGRTEDLKNGICKELVPPWAVTESPSAHHSLQKQPMRRKQAEIGAIDHWWRPEEITEASINWTYNRPI